MSEQSTDIAIIKKVSFHLLKKSREVQTHTQSGVSEVPVREFERLRSKLRNNPELPTPLITRIVDTVGTMYYGERLVGYKLPSADVRRIYAWSRGL